MYYKIFVSRKLNYILFFKSTFVWYYNLINVNLYLEDNFFYRSWELNKKIKFSFILVLFNKAIFNKNSSCFKFFILVSFVLIMRSSDLSRQSAIIATKPREKIYETIAKLLISFIIKLGGSENAGKI
jgi:hypothetical protein